MCDARESQAGQPGYSIHVLYWLVGVEGDQQGTRVDLSVLDSIPCRSLDQTESTATFMADIHLTDLKTKSISICEWVATNVRLYEKSSNVQQAFYTLHQVTDSVRLGKHDIDAHG